MFEECELVINRLVANYQNKQQLFDDIDELFRSGLSPHLKEKTIESSIMARAGSDVAFMEDIKKLKLIIDDMETEYVKNENM